jgi:GxxExxY protein
LRDLFWTGFQDFSGLTGLFLRNANMPESNHDNNGLTGKIIGLAMKIHRTLGNGFLESIYQNALAHEFAKAGVEFQKEAPLDVRYDGVLVGKFSADMVVQNKLIIETKAVRELVIAHEHQLINYLTATGIDEGLLLNFGAERLQFKKKFRHYRPTSPKPPPPDLPNPDNPEKS